MKTDNIPLPKSGGETLDKAGVKPTGYLDKKGTPDGNDVKFNALPPGMDIEDQKVSDVSRTCNMPFKTVTDLGYPGDGWN